MPSGGNIGVEELRKEAKQAIEPILEVARQMGLDLSVDFGQGVTVSFNGKRIELTRKGGVIKEITKWVSGEIAEHCQTQQEIAVYDSMLTFIKSCDFGGMSQPNCWFFCESYFRDIDPLYFDFSKLGDFGHGITFNGVDYYASEKGVLKKLIKAINTWKKEQEEAESRLEAFVNSYGWYVFEDIEMDSSSLVLTLKGDRTLTVPKKYAGQKFLLWLRSPKANYFKQIRPAIIMKGGMASKANFPRDIFMPDVSEDEKDCCINEICERLKVQDKHYIPFDCDN